MSKINDKNKGAGGDDNLVAEYVLGVLSADDHAAMAARIADDRVLQAEALFWQHRFSSLDEGYEEVAAPAGTLGKVEARLFGATTSANPIASLWQNLALWRGLAVGGIAIAALAIGIFFLQPNTGAPIGATTQLVATLTAEQSDVKFLAVYDSTRGTVRLAALSGEKVPNRDYELWLINGDNAPVSLGLVPVDGKAEVSLSDDLRKTISEGTVLAVTLEPSGGAPEGKPTGPIVAAGAVTTV